MAVLDRKCDECGKPASHWTVFGMSLGNFCDSCYRAANKRMMASAQVQREFMLLDELLTDRERAFVEAVYRTPDCKYPGGDAIWDTVDITENDVTVWLKPEQLGLVVCTGTYKWKPTERLCLGCTV